MTSLASYLGQLATAFWRSVYWVDGLAEVGAALPATQAAVGRISRILLYRDKPSSVSFLIVLKVIRGNPLESLPLFQFEQFLFLIVGKRPVPPHAMH